MKRFICVIIGVMIVSFCGQAANSQSRYDSLTTSLNKLFAKDNLPGMSVVLVDSTHIIYEHGFGYADIEKQIHYTSYLIEVKSGISYAKFTEKYILKPLRMNSSGWFLNARDLNKYARPYKDVVSSFPFYQYITYPDGGLRSNTADLSKYLIALINGYKGDKSLLSSHSYRTMFSPQFSKDHPPQGINLSRRNKGIFWNLYTDGTIGHDGDDPGVSSFLFFNPKTGRGGVFLCNKYMEDKSEIINLLVRATN